MSPGYCLLRLAPTPLALRMRRTPAGCMPPVLRVTSQEREALPTAVFQTLQVKDNGIWKGNSLYLGLERAQVPQWRWLRPIRASVIHIRSRS